MQQISVNITYVNKSSLGSSIIFKNIKRSWIQSVWEPLSKMLKSLFCVSQTLLVVTGNWSQNWYWRKGGFETSLPSVQTWSIPLSIQSKEQESSPYRTREPNITENASFSHSTNFRLCRNIEDSQIWNWDLLKI